MAPLFGCFLSPLWKWSHVFMNAILWHEVQTRKILQVSWQIKDCRVCIGLLESFVCFTKQLRKMARKFFGSLAWSGPKVGFFFHLVLFAFTLYFFVRLRKFINKSHWTKTMGAEHRTDPERKIVLLIHLQYHLAFQELPKQRRFCNKILLIWGLCWQICAATQNRWDALCSQTHNGFCSAVVM